MTKNLRALSALGMRTAMMLAVVMISMFASPYGVWARGGQVVATVLSSGQENPVENTDLEAAFAAAKNNDEITLLTDCALAADSENGLLGKLVLGNGTAETNVVLDLNGHTISGSADELITVTANAYLTITDRSTDGKGSIVTTGDKAILNVGILAVIGGSVSGKTCGIYSRGTHVTIGIGSTLSVTICAGTISGGDYGLYIEQGVANISGGTFVATGTGGIGIACATASDFYFLGLPTFNCTVADISLAKDQKIEFADGSYAAPTNKIKVKVANTAPYIFTMVYGRYVKNDGVTFDPETVFEYYDASAGLSFKLVDNGDYGTDVQIYQKDPLSGKRIAVIADPHVMPASLLTNPSNTDWTTYLAGSRKLVDYSQTLFDQAVATLKSDKPELVLIVGDLTKDGEQASHNYLKGKLDELKAAGIPTLVIPGNHDLGSSDAKIYGATTTAAPTISQSGFAQLYQDYGYGSTSERESTTSLTYACEPIKGLVVIGIDSGEEGQLPTATLTWVCDKAVTARAAGKQVIAMMHHPLIPHITGGEAFVSTVSVADYATVRNSLADAGISVVFTGHFHTSDIARDWNGDKSLPIYDVTTGSLCSYPCDYRVVTLNDALTQLQIDTRSITSAGAPLGGGDNFTTAIAKSRLSGSMVNILTPRLTDKLVKSGTSELAATLAVSMIAPRLVDAYIYHAEGDEHKNSDAQTLLSGLNQLLESYPAYKTMANSMLEDKSNYGTDRFDQTNDRSLSVSIEMVIKAVQSEWITLDGGPFTYTGQAIEPAVTVTDGGTDVTSCFDVEYSNNTNAGAGTDATAPTVTVKAKSGQVKYQGSVTKTFTITPKPVTVKSGLAASEVTDNGVTTYSVDASNATITGALNDEKLTIKGVEAMAIAGNKKEVTLDYTKATLMLGENQASNYVLAQAGNQATAAITRSTIKEPVDWDKEKNTINGIEYYKFNKETLSKILNTNGEIEPSMFSDHNNVTFVQEITEDADGHETVKYSLIFGESKELTHVTVMGAEVGMSCLCVGNDFVGSATEGLALASNVGPDGVSSFAQMGGGSMRQETGARAMVRGADDEMKIEWGVEYLILKDCDLEFILHTEKGPITIESITFRRPGDANGDDKVNAVDLVEMINAKNGKASERFNLTNADIDRDGDITQTDIDFVVKLIME